MVDVIPLRAVVLQCLLLAVAIAIEAIVLFRMLKPSANRSISPKESVQYAASINLLSTILGWFAFFSFFGIETSLPLEWSRHLETALLNFVFFNQFSDQSLSVLIVLGFFTFFASFAVKQVGLWGLLWLLQSEYPQASRATDLDQERNSIVGLRDLRKDPRHDNQLNLSAVLFANAWSYSAILLILLILTI